jgi:ribosome-associated heat shock protein Hsp15
MGDDQGKVRIDQFLWAVRQFKTRSLSTDACKRNWITINEKPVKPSSQIKPGDLIKVNRPSHMKKIHVIKVLKCRVAAKCLKDYIEDLTSQDEKLKEEAFNKNRNYYVYSSTKGRPTKKNRRDLEEFFQKIEDSS